VGLSPSKQLLDRFTSVGFGGLSQMQIDHRGGQRRVSQILLDDLQADARFKQVGGIRMPERMGADFLAEVDLVGDQLHRILHRLFAHGILSDADATSL
jgi:hypothetical protein